MFLAVKVFHVPCSCPWYMYWHGFTGWLLPDIANNHVKTSKLHKTKEGGLINY